ncbi:hypothetical protein [Pseudonocardia sp. HH130630-07]|uniref:hypothetical protein n=1 Tax=Pseudonocardia sp. HH130630-07 TaxID=1690815 RepID=UPI000814DAB2|nr:hypothetical protein [Pseudonocardia sp. HH130630-07]ANY07796.1 hypothetical protein AFB00_17515 [Pseudonocardia sp. HH130630-07]
MSATTRIAAVAAATLLLFVLVVAASLAASIGSVGPGGASAPSPSALADIPPDQLVVYQHAATVCPGLDWTVLATIGKVETDHGRSTLPGVHDGENPFHAAGPMQIIPATWNAILVRHRIPPGGANPPSRYNAHDAAHAAAFNLCDNGAPRDLRGAVFAYNHSTAYVDQVLDQATRYRASPPSSGPESGDAATVPDPTGTGGRITPRMDTLYRALDADGAVTRGATCWDPHPQNPTSDHPAGRACDIFYTASDPTSVTRGWDVARWLTANAARYGVKYVIWQGRIWTTSRPTWATYRSTIYGCPDPTEITGCHYDHIHISVY